MLASTSSELHPTQPITTTLLAYRNIEVENLRLFEEAENLRSKNQDLQRQVRALTLQVDELHGVRPPATGSDGPSNLPDLAQSSAFLDPRAVEPSAERFGDYQP